MATLILEEEASKKSMDWAMDLPMALPLLEPPPPLPSRPLMDLPFLEPLPPLQPVHSR